MNKKNTAMHKIMFENKNKKANIRRYFIAVIFVTFLGIGFIGGAALAQQASEFGLQYGTGLLLGTRDIRETIFQIINIVLGFLGIVALGVVVYAGYVWMTAGGNAERINKAKKILLNAVIGLIIILSAFGIVQFILSRLGEATGLLEPCDTEGATETCSSGGCTGTRVCQSNGYWSACDTGPCVPGSGPYFYIQSTSPYDGETDVIRNKVIRVTFNREPDSASVVLDNTFILTKNNTADPSQQEHITDGYFNFNGKVLEFYPYPNTQCTFVDQNTNTTVDVYDSNGNPVYGCLDANTQYTLKLIDGANGIVSVDGYNLNCTLSQPCEITFTTGEIIDTESPQIGIEKTGQFCAGGLNTVTANGWDDAGIDYVEFMIDGNVKAKAPTDGGTTLNTNGNYPDVTFTATWDWDTSDLSAGGTYGLSATAYDVDKHYTTSETRNVTLYPEHCCNGKQDQDEGELGIDCGGECAACAGAECDLGDTDSNTCLTPSDDLCYYNYCDPDSCLCLTPPIIDYIEPVDEYETPIGAEGNLFTIWGRNFGNSQGSGKVLFLGYDIDGDGNAADADGNNYYGGGDDVVADLPSTVNSYCTDTWSDTQIIMVVPSGAQDGPIMVVTNEGLTDVTDDVDRGEVLPDFDVDSSYTLPGVCKIDPDQGEFADEFTLYGINFDGFVDFLTDDNDSVIFGTDTEAYNRDNWSVNTVGDQYIKSFVPNLANGTHTVRAVVDGGKSNGINFQIGIPENAPTILDIEPTEGGIGQYVTISGSNFGTSPGTVYFYNPSYGYTAYGDTSFPEQCSDNWWRDSQIIVKVPAEYTNRDDVKKEVHDVYIETATSLESNHVDFTITKDVPGPGLCALSPESGDVGTFVTAYGERFGASAGRVTFYDEKEAQVSDSSWEDGEIDNIKVPEGAVTGPVYVYDVSDNQSNPINFTVGSCESDSDCASPAKCCQEGLYEGSCVDPNIIDCNGNYVPSSYSWPFSTAASAGPSEKTPPHVVEDMSCTNGSLQSPSPWPSSTDVCVNIAASARFDKKMDLSYLTKDYIYLKQCDDDGNGNPDTSSCKEVDRTVESFENSDGTNGFILYPVDASENMTDLSPNKWYMVKIDDQVRSDDGALLDGDNNGYERGDYEWYFKTREDITHCQPSYIEVMPAETTINYMNGTKGYTAAAVSSECYILPQNTWKWESTQKDVATVTDTKEPKQTATAVGEGKTYIKATETNSGLNDSGLLIVSFADLKVIGYWPNCNSACINSNVGAQFNLELDTSTLIASNPANENTDSILLYECTNNDSSCQWPNLELVTVDSDGTIDSENYNAYDSVLNVFPSEFDPRLENGTFYRVVLDGSITAWNGEKLSNKNFSLGSGEDCDDGNTYNGDGCSSSCLNEGSSGSAECGNGKVETGEDCDDGNTYDGDGCSSSCLNEGSNFAYRCGNGVVDHDPDYGGEDCDDGNLENGDGCSDRCLNEGSSPTASSRPICGDGRVDLDLGEECDDGNTDNGDGCSDRCLNESGECDDGNDNNNDGCTSSGLNAGTNHATCGNFKIETGEDCDDGNTVNGDGCSSICLNEGSMGSAQCGNGKVEGGESDGFSWVFKVGDNPDMCEVKRVTVSPSDYISYIIGDTRDYYTYPYSEPDECSSNGQMLDPWYYNWRWQPSNGSSINNIDGLDKNVAQIHDPENGTYYPVDSNGDGDIDPVQEVIGIGEGTLDENSQQTTLIATQENSTSVTCADNGGECGSYTLQCGFQEDSDCLNACDTSSDTCIANPKLSCTSDIDCAGVGYDTCCVQRPSVESTSPGDGDTDVCRNAIIEVVFDQKMDTSSLKGSLTIEKDTVGVSCSFAQSTGDSIWSKIAVFFQKLFTKVIRAQTWCSVPGTSSYYTNSDGNTTMTFQTSDYMDANTDYRVTILGDDDLYDGSIQGVRNKYGVAMNGSYEWQFKTGADVCDIDYVQVTVFNNGAGQSGEATDNDLFSCYGDDCADDYDPDPGSSGNQHYYFAQAMDITGVELFSSSGIVYSWDEYDSDDAIEIREDPYNTSNSQELFVTNNPKEDAEAVVAVNADGSDGGIGTASQEVDVRVFLCNNPWPDFDSFPFEDSKDNCYSDQGEGDGCFDYHFETYYCRDKGDVNSTSDDLPELESDRAEDNECKASDGDCVVITGWQNKGEQDIQEELMKEFLFFRKDGSPDAIGIRIYENEHGFSPIRWYNENVPNPGSPTTIQVDGYEAVQDGRTVYVAATNKPDSNSLYTNIYLMSYSEGADNDTIEIFNQMLDNWHFNLNVDNDGVCVSSAPVIEPDLKWEWPADGDPANINIDPDSYHIMTTPLVVDLDNDGNQEIVVITFDSDKKEYQYPYNDGILRVLDADTGEEDEDFTNTAKEYRVNPIVSMAAGDIDNDGYMEIVAGWSQDPDVGNLENKGIVVFEHNGEMKWTVDDIRVSENSVVTLADLNQDGRVEVIIGDWVFDGETGEKYWQESVVGYTTTTTSVAMDIDKDVPGLELIAGDTMYYADGSKKWTNNQISLSYPTVIDDITGDGVPDIVSMPGGKIQLINGANGNLERSDELPDSGGGPPVVADFVGDGGVYAGVFYKNGFGVYQIVDENGQIDEEFIWTNNAIVDSASAKTGASAFDFNNDGAYEILTQDNNNVFVFNGPDGEILWSNTAQSATLIEHPIVADIDNDDIAELIVVSNSYGDNACEKDGPPCTGLIGVRVFEQDDIWAGARSIWNQYNYFITNVDDYGNIPTEQQNPWEAGYHSFRAQTVFGGPVYCTRDDQCPGSVCSANKDKLVRDTKRLADLREMQIIANEYNSSYGEFPLLEAGTYVPGVSFSVWPSWDETLASELSAALYKDPINKFYGCEDPFDSTTCWDETSQTFYCPEEAYVYGYQTQGEGDIGKFYMTMEYAADFEGSFAGDIAQCNDGIDNDSDGLIDFVDENGDGNPDSGSDPGCIDEFDDTELDSAPDYYNSVPQCNDGIDNDSDGSIDFGNDPGCVNEYDDTEEDGAANVCLGFYGTVENDYDADGVADADDNCYSVPNPYQLDTDSDGIGDMCDDCPQDSLNDTDGDNLCANEDNCENVYNPDQNDHDGDGVGDACDIDYAGEGVCTGDADSDGVCDENDNCPTSYNPYQEDQDEDGIGDACDACPTGVDQDEDGICGEISSGTGDNCPDTYNPDQSDGDGDGIGDACDTCYDPDKDGYGTYGYDISGCLYSTTEYDNCPNDPNPDQSDSDGDGIGDDCDDQVCGNGRVEGDEECDGSGGEGTSSTDQYECSDECTWTGGWCGDTVVQSSYNEECDTFGGDGSDQDNQYECSSECKWTGGWCGDYIIQTDYGEWCDEGEDGGKIEGEGWGYDSNHQYECTRGTTVAEGGCQQTGGWCGDGEVQGSYGEECDEGAEEIPTEPIHIVFALDTSDSMGDEWDSLCQVLQNTINNITDISEIEDIEYKVYAYHSDRDPKVKDKTSCVMGNVAGDNSIYSTCTYSFTYYDKTSESQRTISGPITNQYEDSGPAVTDISYCEDWEDGYIRIIVPISDEAWQDGDPWRTHPENDNDNDTYALNAAEAAAINNSVYVVPIYAGSDSDKVNDMSKATGVEDGAIEYINNQDVNAADMECYIRKIIYSVKSDMYCDADQDGYMDCTSYKFSC